MKKWTLLFDVDRCNGCCNCVLATMDEYVGNRHAGYAEEMPRHGRPWLTMRVVERGADRTVDVAYTPETCRHCEDAPCIRSAPHCVTRRPDGIVFIDPVKAKGARELVQACPFGAIHWNEELQLPQHWNLDAHLLDAGWREPRASQACPTGALQVVALDDTQTAALSGQGYARPEKERQLGSRLYTKGLHRLQSELIGGSVTHAVAGREEPLFPATVALHAHGRQLGVAVTNEMGAFLFDGLGPLSGPIELVVDHDEARSRWTFESDAFDGRYRVGVLRFDGVAASDS
jgi:Fe-S-cluster-containing dehydrogenase component